MQIFVKEQPRLRLGSFYQGGTFFLVLSPGNDELAVVSVGFQLLFPQRSSPNVRSSVSELEVRVDTVEVSFIGDCLVIACLIPVNILKEPLNIFQVEKLVSFVLELLFLTLELALQLNRRGELLGDLI